RAPFPPTNSAASLSSQETKEKEYRRHCHNQEGEQQPNPGWPTDKLPLHHLTRSPNSQEIDHQDRSKHTIENVGPKEESDWIYSQQSKKQADEQRHSQDQVKAFILPGLLRESPWSTNGSGYSIRGAGQ